MWELHTELLSKELQEFLWDNLKMKDGECGGMLKVGSIFDLLTAFQQFGLLQMTNEDNKVPYYKRVELESEIYQGYREKVWGDFSIKRDKIRKRYRGRKDELTEHLARYEYFLLIKFLVYALDTCPIPAYLRKKLEKKARIPYKAVSVKKKIKYSQWTMSLVDKITRDWKKR